jgi:hypothetical protein
MTLEPNPPGCSASCVRRSAFGEERAQVLGEGGEVGDGGGLRLRRHRRRDEGVGPVSEALAVAGRHAEHLEDHDRRERVGDVGDEVHLPALLDGAHELVRDRFDVW